MLTNEELRAEAEAARGNGLRAIVYRANFRDAATPERVLALLDEIDRLKAAKCEQPNVASCARQWEADHQRAALEHSGISGEFPYGCDAIEHVAEALIAARREIDRLKERSGNLSKRLNRAYAERDAANDVITNLTDRNN